MSHRSYRKYKEDKEKKRKRIEALSGWRYAHRGLFSKPGIPENSRAAFRRAADNGYGAELDVHLMADGTLAVIHDSELRRMTGKEGIVENCTRGDLPHLFLGGTSETVPTFEEVLQIVGGRTPLIVELKTWNGNAAGLAGAVCKVLDDYEGLYCIESFDPRVLLWLRRRRPDVIRGILSQDFVGDRNGLSFLGAVNATHMTYSLLTRPDFIAYRFKDRKALGNRFGLKVMKCKGASWTIRTPGQLRAAEAEGLWPIFEENSLEDNSLKG